MIVAEQHIDPGFGQVQECSIHVSAGPADTYEIHIKGGYPDPTDRFKVVKKEETPIPEFPTVAIPAAGILTLFYLLNRRGYKKIE